MKHRRTTAKLTGDAGFTLIELLTVGLIIIALVGIVIAAASYAQRRAAIQRTKAEIAVISQALEAYKLDNSVYPASGIANVKVALADGSKTYMSFRPDQLSGNNIIDPFGTAYAYNRPGADGQNNVAFDLWSFGPDRKDTAGFKEDNVTNW